jgi:hypothetical protein
MTMHAGRGLRENAIAFRLDEAILTASAQHRPRIFIEMHRATTTQDLRRTVATTKKFPADRFNREFSLYCCGKEFVFGDWDGKLAFMQSIFNGVGFLHGRIASTCFIQVPIRRSVAFRSPQVHGQLINLDNFKEFLMHARLGLFRTACPCDMVIIARELLSGEVLRLQASRRFWRLRRGVRSLFSSPPLLQRSGSSLLC